ncbi:MAG: efflux RND transporter periplasmic adaptor subunit [Candidatus Sumerlaeia bacterium]|nr:efflux RND transporter periplasmic adaptor subunit [Candidatus Sumerlaeia bacterium]
MRTLLRNVFLLASAIVLGALGWAVYSKLSQEAPVPPPRGRPAVAIEVRPVVTGPIRDVRRMPGTLFASNEVDIAPKIGGRLARLNVDIGDVVRRGDEIARLDDDELTQEVMRAQSDLEVARANLRKAHAEAGQAAREYERVAILADRRVASPSDLDAALMTQRVKESDVKVAEAAIMQREAILRTAEIRLSYTRIVADWQGGTDTRVVGERFANEGAVLQSNQRIVSLLDIDTLRAVVHATERDYPRLRVGQTARVVADAFPGRAVEGQISRLAPLFREASRQARTELAVPNPDHVFKPGMFIRAEILLGERDSTTLVPVASLVDREGQRGVFVVDGETKTARFVPVTVGIIEGQTAEILDPPLTGDVVTLGQNLLDDGAAVLIPDGTPRPASVAAGATPEAAS